MLTHRLQVGDDVLGDDPTVTELQEQVINPTLNETLNP